VGTECGHQLSNKELPKTEEQYQCTRSIWPDSSDDRCILHTRDRVNEAEELAEAIAEESRIDDLNLDGEKLPEGFTFEGMALYSASFQNADLTRCKFTETKITDARFEGATLERAYFGPEEYSEGPKVDNIKSVVRTRKETEGNFDGADLSGATFIEEDLMGSEFDCDNMRSVDFIDCALSELSFANENLRDSDFSYSLLRQTTFSDCDLHNSTFHGSNLDQTQFTNCTLKHADLRNAILDETEFIDVQINQNTEFDSYLVQEYLADQYSEGLLEEKEAKNAKEYLHTRRSLVPIDFEAVVNRQT